MVSALLALGMGYLSLGVYPDRVVPLAYGLPLLVCLWNRSLRLLYAMALLFSCMVMAKAMHLIPWYDGPPGYEPAVAIMMLLNIWVVVGVVHALITALNHLELRNQQLQDSNTDLEVSNRELAAREEEITQQNEELRSQAEELEQQSEELRQTAEESEHQASELQMVNAELSRRERGLRTLLESARWIRTDVSEHELMSAICRAAVQLMEDDVAAAAIVQEKDGHIWLRGHWGFGVHGTLARDCRFQDSFAALVIESGRTAYLPDSTHRPDIDMPQPVMGRPFRSVLAAPIWTEGRPIGAVELYRHEPHEWTDEEFRVIEWVASQGALALRAFEFQRELDIKRREAEEASVQKTRFLAAVSHDVRTPANAISLLAEWIESTAQSPEGARELPELARDLRANARALVELVSDVLDLARFDAGKPDLQITEFALASFIEAELRPFYPIARVKGLRLSTLLMPEPVWVRTDRMKLARVLANLVGNAVKFTEDGEIRVGVRRGADELIELAVTDTGTGISPAELPHIFDEFHQLRNPERDRSKGAGLGLAICRRLVDTLGCSISVESTPGRGSTFVLRLPAEIIVSSATNLPAVLPESPPADESAFLANMRILLVEDHEATRTAASRLLENHGAIVLQAGTAREAIHLITHEEPQVLLLDLMLPDFDGAEVLRQLQYYRPGSLQCVLAVSGDVRPERVEEVKRLGAADLIPKPIKLDSLLAILRDLLAGTERNPDPDDTDEVVADG